MILHFRGGATSECKILKEGRIYITFRAKRNGWTYQVNKETGEVRDNTYKKVIKGMFVEN